MPNGPAGVMTVRHMHRHGQPSTDRRLEPIPPSIQVAKGSKTQHKRLDNMEHSTGIGIPNWQVPHTQPKLGHYFTNQAAGWLSAPAEQALWWLQETSGLIIVQSHHIHGHTVSTYKENHRKNQNNVSTTPLYRYMKPK